MHARYNFFKIEELRPFLPDVIGLVENLRTAHRPVEIVENYAFCRHAAELESAMAVLNASEKRQLHALLKKLGVFAAGAGSEAGTGKEISK